MRVGLRTSPSGRQRRDDHASRCVVTDKSRTNQGFSRLRIAA